MRAVDWMVFVPANLFLIFNHQITPVQEADAFASMGVGRIVNLPEALQQLWRQIPPDLRTLSQYLEPLRLWLTSDSEPGDYVLIQGDFGACYLMVSFAFERGFIPVYSTSRREALEEHQPDGTVKLTHHFQHQIFRRYGA